MNPKKFMVSTSWYNAIKDLDKETRCDLYDAIFSYIETGVIPTLPKEIAVAFSLIKIDLDIRADSEEKRKAKLRENASKGGRRTQSKRKQQKETTDNGII